MTRRSTLRERTQAAALAASSFAAFGCEPPPSIDESEVGERMLDAMCGRAEACACPAFDGSRGTENSCRTRHSRDLEDLLETGERLGSRYDGVCAQRWVDFLGELGCARFDELETLRDYWGLVGCKIYTLGPPASGASEVSRFGDSCALDEYATRFLDVDLVRSVCLPLAAADVGDSCDADIPLRLEPCREGLQCVAGQCARLSRLGEPCESSAACEGDLVCNSVDASCVLGRFEGEPCDGNERLCVSGSFCGTDATCHLLPGEGEWCHLNDRSSKCADGFDCAADLRCWPDKPSYCVQVAGW